MVLPKPIDIKNKLDEYVVGQDEAKRFCLLPFTITISVFLRRR